MTIYSRLCQLVVVFGAVLSLSACAETQLLSHYVKKLPWGGSEMASNGQSQGAYKVGKPYKVDGRWYQPRENFQLVETGVASWYGPGFHAKKTANGETFDQNAMTAAHRTLQLPSLVKVTNLENGRSVVVRVNDRGPYKSNRVMDVSSRAADLLGFKGKGTARVRIEVLTEESKVLASAAKSGQDTTRMTLASLQGPAAAQPYYASQTAPTTTSRPVHAGGPYGALASADRGWNIRQDAAMKKGSGGDPSLPESLQPTTVTAEELREDIDFQQAAHRPAVEADIAPAAGGTASVKPVEAEAVMAPVTSYPVTERTPVTRASSPSFVPAVSSIPTRTVKPVEREASPAVADMGIATGTGHVFIQAGSFSIYENASKLVDRLEPYAPAKIDPITMKGREFFRVRIGPFESADKARALLGQVIDAGNPTARVVVD